MYKVTAKVTLRTSILDPQGNATQHALESLGFDSIEHVRIGKLVEMDIGAGDRDAAVDIANRACEKLLANPVMDDFEIIEVEDVS